MQNLPQIEKDEFARIVSRMSYSEARDKEPMEPGSFHLLTPVHWDDATPKDYQIAVLQTIGEVRVLRIPRLPLGYKMVTPSETINLLLQIYDGRKTYTPEYVERAWADVGYLVHSRLCGEWVMEAAEVDGVSFLSDGGNCNIEWWGDWRHKWSLGWLEAFADCGIVEVEKATRKAYQAIADVGKCLGHDFCLNEVCQWETKEELFECASVVPLPRKPYYAERFIISSAFRAFVGQHSAELREKAEECDRLLQAMPKLMDT